MFKRSLLFLFLVGSTCLTLFSGTTLKELEKKIKEEQARRKRETTPDSDRERVYHDMVTKSAYYFSKPSQQNFFIPPHALVRMTNPKNGPDGSC